MYEMVGSFCENERKVPHLHLKVVVDDTAIRQANRLKREANPSSVLEQLSLPKHLPVL